MSDSAVLLQQVERDDARASGHLLPLAYDELRRLAAQKMAPENPRQTLKDRFGWLTKSNLILHNPAS